MPTITLLDGSQKHFEAPLSVMDVAAAIGPGLAKATLAGDVDGQCVDASFIIDKDVQLSIITAKDERGLEIIRHSCAHLMAQAVKQLYPMAQVTIGPVIDDGFYYDFALEQAFTPEDLAAIEKRMQELVKQNLPVTRRSLSRNDAIAYFLELGETYKAKIIEDIPEDETLTLYKQGDFEDLCRGPHLPATGKMGAFKLTKLAGAYWRGDSKNAMLQRIYGTAWPDKKALKAYLHRLEEAEKRDHRRIGKQLGLFHFQEEAPGMAFWHHNGLVIYRVIQDYIRHSILANGYQEISTPEIVDVALWERSGHLGNFADEMFITETENRTFAIKPMNCPGAIQVFNHGLTSYKDLPIRFSEFGNCHRCEPSGALHGLMRVRNFVQDDGHIFCTEDQIEDEVSRFIDLTYKAYHDFGFDDIILKLSTRPEKRVGDDDIWDKAESALAAVLDNKQLNYTIAPGEGAFYGPKIEFSLRDTLGRVWQCGTIQIDFSMPARLDAHYIGQDSARRTPVMIHRAMLGSFERFIGILIEHYAGKFPVWLAPTQAVVMNITDAQSEYVKKVTENLQNQGFRVNSDLRNEKIGYKIRSSTLARIPYMIVIGDREVENNQLSVRTQAGEDLGSMSVDDFIQRLHNDNQRKGRID